MAIVVLVHGGGHGGWCWRACANELRARGHEVYAPTLTGFGDRAHLPAPDFETFVTDIANEHTRRLVQGMIDLAHGLDLVVVAEGVEDELALMALIEMGCDFAQGYHIGRPQPAGAFLDAMTLKESS